MHRGQSVAGKGGIKNVDRDALSKKRSGSLTGGVVRFRAEDILFWSSSLTGDGAADEVEEKHSRRTKLTASR